MKRVFLAAAAVTIGVTAVFAQADAIAQRKELMKQVGGQTRVSTQMSRGETPFDLDKAKAVFATYQEAGTKFAALFPDTTKTGDTAALPAVWEKKADFDARAAKFAADAKEQGEKVKDLDTLKVALGEVTKNCGGCHETYRAKR